MIETAADGVELVLAPAFILMGLSHIVRPAMWADLFAHLHSLGPTGVVYRTFMLELWPALVILTLHQVWTGPGVVLTLYGILLSAKCVLAMLWPEMGMRSMAMAQRGAAAFIPGGAALLALGFCCIWALLS